MNYGLYCLRKACYLTLAWPFWQQNRPFPDQSIRKLELELELQQLELQDKASEREAAARIKEPGGIYIIVTSSQSWLRQSQGCRAWSIWIGAWSLWQKCRRYKKLDSHTFSEFGREKEALFDCWCHSSKVMELEQLRELILLEKLKNCLSHML